MIEKINSIKEYSNYIENYKGNFYFRGQANSEWNIEPQIFRNEANLSNESSIYNISEDINTDDMARKILELQHYGTPTRLCDITVNPLVALYFAIENDTMDMKDSCVYTFNRENELEFNSERMRILFLLSCNEIHTIEEFQNLLQRQKITISNSDLKKLIEQNYCIKYKYEFSWSNQRAMLQGGTGIYFGFHCIENRIERKGRSPIASLVDTVIIPSNSKSRIRDELKRYGLSKEILYDLNKGNGKIRYQMEVKKDKAKRLFNKLYVKVKIEDILFNEEEIQNIAEEIWDKMKCEYGYDARIFMYIYYDEQDIRDSNWIARPTPDETFYSFQLNYKKNYFQERMNFLNREISINEIFVQTKPIVDNVIQMFRNCLLTFR